MTPEDLIPLVHFQKEKEGYRIKITASLIIHAEMSLDDRYENDKEALDHVKQELTAMILRRLYDDQRRDLYEAVEALQYCNPLDFAAQHEATMNLFKVARFQKPRLSKCCKARVKVAGGKGEGSTCWYQCLRCSAGCDIIPPVSG